MPSGDGKSLEFSHQVINHAVSIDISVPGWWPRVVLDVEKAWIGNWSGDKMGGVFESGEGIAHSEMVVYLPRNKADMEALTQALIRGVGKPIVQPEIAEIRPGNVTLCKQDSTLTLQVRGRNLWQGAQAFLNGVPQSELLILPDMGGVSITFDVRNLPKLGDDSAVLTIWTRDGRTTPKQGKILLNRADENNPFCATKEASSESLPGDLSLLTLWFKVDDKVKLSLKDSSALKSYNQLLVKARPVAGPGIVSAASPKVVATDPSFDEKTGGFEVQMTAAINKTLAIKNGSFMEFSVDLTPRPGADAVKQVAKPLAVYYSDDSVKIDTSGEVTVSGPSANFDVKVLLPPKPDIRFTPFPPPKESPGKDRLELSAFMAADDAASIKTSTALTGGKSWKHVDTSPEGREIYQTTFKLLPPSGATEAADFAKILKTTGITVHLILMGPPDTRAGGDRSEVKATIKLKSPN